MKLQRRNTSVHGRPVILQARWHLDDLRFDVLRNLQDGFRRAFIAEMRRQRAADRDVQGRRARDTGTGGGLATGRQPDTVSAEAMNEAAEERQCVVVSQLIERQVDRPIGVFRQQLDPLVGPRLDPGPGAEADGGVERLSAGMKEIERPDVDGAAGQINSCGSGRRDAHDAIIILEAACLWRRDATLDSI